MNDKKIVLASSSPRRRELLHNIVDEFEITSPESEEIGDGEPKNVSLTNAILKARGCKVKGDVIIACDTLVACEGKIYGKPYTAENAVKMIKELSGKWHSVFSGVCIKTAEKEITFVEESKVKFNDLKEVQIIDYVNKYSPLDKAGSYGIQDGVVVERYLGDFDNIVGLPVKKVSEILKELGYVK